MKDRRGKILEIFTSKNPDTKKGNLVFRTQAKVHMFWQYYSYITTHLALWHNKKVRVVIIWNLEGWCYETFNENCCLICANIKDVEISKMQLYEQPISLKNLMVLEQKAGEVQNSSVKKVRLAKHEEFGGR